MDIQEQFYDYIEKNDINNVKLLLKNENINPLKDNNWAIRIASENGCFDIFKLLFFFNDKRADPSATFNASIQFASQNGHLDIVKFLLKDKRVNPSDFNNLAIFLAFSNHHFDIVNILWQVQRVKNTLKKDRPDLYNQLIVKEKIEEF